MGYIPLMQRAHNYYFIIVTAMKTQPNYYNQHRIQQMEWYFYDDQLTAAIKVISSP